MDDSKVNVPANRQVNFGQAIVLFFINYFEFSGRSSAGAYWYFALWSFLLVILFAVMDLTFDLVDKYLNSLPKGLASWTKPTGGYFISFDSKPGQASKIFDLC